MYAIKTINLTKKYKDLVAVDNLNLQISKGELFSLLGVNGAGKTTTIKMLSCLTKPTSGDALVGGSSVTNEEINVKKVIGVSPQETAVAPNLSVKENLELMCGIHGFSKEKSLTKLTELSNQFMLVLSVTVIGTAYQNAVHTGIVRSGGDTAFVFKVDTIFMWCIVLPMSFLSAYVFKWPLVVTFICLKGDQILKCFIAFWKVNYGKWLKNVKAE